MTLEVGGLDFDVFTVKDENGNSQTYSMRDLLKFNENNYEVALTSQASMYSYFANTYQIAKEQVENANNALTRVHAEIYNRVYLELNKQGLRPTKDLVEAQIVGESDYQDKLKDVAQANRLAGQLQYLVKALEQRKDMLVQYSAEQRKSEKYSN